MVKNLYPPAPHPIAELKTRQVTRAWLAFFEQLAAGSFSTVHVAGDGSTTAATAGETLTFAAGGGITITLNPSTDTLTFSTSNIASQVTAIKHVTQAVTNSASLQNDTELSFPIGANETWAVDLALYVSGAPTGGFQWAIKAPAGAVGKHGAHRLPFGSTTAIDQLDVSISGQLGDAGALSAGLAT